MKNYFKNNKFGVTLQKEGDYFRVHVTHPSFKGRIRKRLGDKASEELDNFVLNIRYELGKSFNDKQVNKQEVQYFLEEFIARNLKNTVSIFDYKEEFFTSKENLTNKRTRKKLTKSTLSGYKTALKYFEEFFNKKRIPPHPSQITDSNLNDFYEYLEGSHNYRVKIHNKVKGFIKFLTTVKNMNIDPRYKLSVYNEEYDNLAPEGDDIALSANEVAALIDLRKKLLRKEIAINSKPINNKLPLELQMHNKEKLESNLIKSLDCFLFMIATGQYWADIRNSVLYFSRNGNNLHMKYRRSKNNTLCKAIPISDDAFFIGGEIIKQYGIKNGSNFPLNLSLTHFDKHLHRISVLANLNIRLTNKMARKTFASELYFNRGLPINLLQILLGHQDVRDTAHYLRISDDNIAMDILSRIQQVS